MLLVLSSTYAHDHAEQNRDTLASQHFVAWVKQKILQKAAFDKQLQAQTTVLNLSWLEEKLNEFMLALAKYDSMHNLRISQLVGSTADDFDTLYAGSTQRGHFIRLGVDQFVDYLKNKPASGPYPDGAELYKAFAPQLPAFIAAIESEDDDLRAKHADAVFSIADEIERTGFVPEVHVTAEHLKAHTMTEGDARTILADLIDQPFYKDGTQELIVVKKPIQPLTDAERFKQDILSESKQFMALGDTPSQVTLVYMMHDGSSHYDYLEVTLYPDDTAELKLENSMPDPLVTTTATYTSLAAAKKALAEAGFKLKSNVQPVFTGDQDDATSCSFRTLYKAIKKAASNDKIAAKYADIVPLTSNDDVKLASSKRLVTASPRLGKAVADDLELDAETRIVRRKTLQDKQQKQLAVYNKKHIEVRPAKAKVVVSTEIKAAVPANRLKRDTLGFRNLFDFKVTVAKTPQDPILSIGTSIDEKTLDQHTPTLAAVRDEYAALGKTISELKNEKLPKFDFGKTALNIYFDKEQVSAYNQAIEARKVKADQQGTTKAILTAITEDIDQLVQKSQQAVDTVRKTPAAVALVTPSAVEQKAYATLEEKSASVKEITEARSTLTAMHEKMLLNSATFVQTKATPVLKPQELEDAKLARIVQNQMILDYMEARRLQEKADEALARRLSGTP